MQTLMYVLSSLRFVTFVLLYFCSRHLLLPNHPANRFKGNSEGFCRMYHMPCEVV